MLVFEVESKPYCSSMTAGIDVGYSIAAAISTGATYGKDLEPIQRRTKWRKYERNDRKPYRQGLNQIAKQIVKDHPKTDFSVEKLKFTGKRKRSAKFRTSLSRFAYQHLAHRLERLGQSEGFRVFFVNPAYTSQKCPLCGCVDKRSRNGDSFVCVLCGHKNHADTNAAININGGEAIVHYGIADKSAVAANQSQEYPGTMGALTKNMISNLLEVV